MDGERYTLLTLIKIKQGNYINFRQQITEEDKSQGQRGALHNGKGVSFKEDIVIISVYVPNNRASKVKGNIGNNVGISLCGHP